MKRIVSLVLISIMLTIASCSRPEVRPSEGIQNEKTIHVVKLIDCIDIPVAVSILSLTMSFSAIIIASKKNNAVRSCGNHDSELYSLRKRVQSLESSIKGLQNTPPQKRRINTTPIIEKETATQVTKTPPEKQPRTESSQAISVAASETIKLYMGKVKENGTFLSSSDSFNEKSVYLLQASGNKGKLIIAPEAKGKVIYTPSYLDNGTDYNINIGDRNDIKTKNDGEVTFKDGEWVVSEKIEIEFI